MTALISLAIAKISFLWVDALDSSDETSGRFLILVTAWTISATSSLNIALSSWYVVPQSSIVSWRRPAANVTVADFDGTGIYLVWVESQSGVVQLL